MHSSSGEFMKIHEAKAATKVVYSDFEFGRVQAVKLPCENFCKFY